ncbi:MAG: hypothetical protein JNM56_38895 [Planctomycetia bacterium]|nr:hypothetical protein [Planctomycetia bacterium]
MSTPQELRQEVKFVKGGRVRYFGFLKGLNGKPHGLTISRKKIAGPLLQALQQETGNKARPVVGVVRYVQDEGQFVFEVQVSPSPIKSLLKVVVRNLKLPITRFDVRKVEELASEELIEHDASGDGTTGEPAGTGTESMPTKEALTTRLKDLMPLLRPAMTSPNHGEDVQQQLADFQSFLTAGDFAAAGDALDEAEHLGHLALAERKTDFTQRMRRVLVLLEDIKAVDPAAYAQSQNRVQTAGKQVMSGGELAAASAELLAVETATLKLLEEHHQTTPHVTEESESSGGDGPWQTARTKVVADIRTVANAIAATKDPEGQQPLILLYSIIKQLPARLDTPQVMAEVERYVREDDVVAAAENCPPTFGTIRIREPLLKAVAAVRG